MRKFTRSLERHREIVFATTTKEGVGAIHLRHKIPFYKVKRSADGLGISIHAHLKHKDHLMFRNKRGELIGTLVNLNLLLLPKHSVRKDDAIELAQALIKLIS